MEGCKVSILSANVVISFANGYHTLPTTAFATYLLSIEYFFLLNLFFSVKYQ